MSQWEIIQEILSRPVKIPELEDSYYKPHYPAFMKRKSILKTDYEKKLAPLAYSPHNFKTRTISNYSPSLTPYVPYGRASQNRSNSRPDKSSALSTSYDEALHNQRIFTQVSPNDSLFEGDFKSSHCPVFVKTPAHSSPKRKREKLLITDQSPEKSVLHPRKLNIFQFNVNSFLSKKGSFSCEKCSFAPCICRIRDEEIPKKVFQNINKGKSLFSEIKEKNQKQNKTVELNLGKIRKKKIRIDEDLMRYSPVPLNSIPNTGFHATFSINRKSSL
jgi:hypothetical protein